MFDNVKALILSDEQWQELLKQKWERVSANCEDEEDLILEKFYWSGDLGTYIEQCVDEKRLPLWGDVVQCNPNRSMAVAQSNIQQFWAWVLEDPQNRMPDTPSMDIGDYFNEPVLRLGQQNSYVLDPNLNADLFKWIFGYEYRKETIFPLTLGAAKWQPTINVDAETKFMQLSILLNNYLFSGEGKPTPAEHLATLMVDYWLSIIPQLDNLRCFDIDVNDDMSADGEICIAEWQGYLRGLFAGLNGYDVLFEERDELIVHDQVLHDYINEQIAVMDMPEQYNRFMKLIHKHKEDCEFATSI